MRKSWKNKLIYSILVIALLLSACGQKETAHHDTYTCPMHPTVVSDKPGTCPVCGMDLVRKAREGEEVKITADLAQRTKSPNEVVITDIKTVKGEHKKLSVTLSAQGIVTYDMRYTYNIPARVGGRLEKVYIKYTLQSVQKGQAIAEIYSPELLTAQREYLYLLRQDANNTTLIESAKQKLYLLGMTAQQVEALSSRQEPPQTFTVYSPYSGYIITPGNAAPAISASAASIPVDGGMGGSSMSGSTASASTSSGTSASTSPIREGSYVTTGQTLFTVVNTSALRIEVNIPVGDVGIIKKGDVVLLNTGSGPGQKATIDFIQPFFDQDQAFMKVRVYIPHAEGLAVGQLVQASVTLPEAEGFWLPKEAVVDLGLNKVVFIETSGIFKPRKVTTGIATNTMVSVKGVSSSDIVAAHAQYLVDSESFIKTKE
ncbi:MAG TPA: efflux RND transporter periplasmic adaptor subunit [Ohtaekwangia sp.]|uniref:efflux RND transporter periplasmic adaptor subunit n=1 Tax=Ohtaekwangia sp. TaxID=2066019 RepID=UPI002F94C0BC